MASLLAWKLIKMIYTILQVLDQRNLNMSHDTYISNKHFINNIRLTLHYLINILCSATKSLCSRFSTEKKKKYDNIFIMKILKLPSDMICFDQDFSVSILIVSDYHSQSYIRYLLLYLIYFPLIFNYEK